MSFEVFSVCAILDVQSSNSISPLPPYFSYSLCSRCNYLLTVGSNKVEAMSSNKVAAPAAGGKMRLNGCAHNALHCTALKTDHLETAQSYMCTWALEHCSIRVEATAGSGSGAFTYREWSMGSVLQGGHCTMCTVHLVYTGHCTLLHRVFISHVNCTIHSEL